MNIATPQVETKSIWIEANRRHLTQALCVIRGYLQRAGSGAPDAPPPNPDTADATGQMTRPPAIEAIAGTFALSPFERDVLLLCAGVELDTEFAAICAAAQGDPQHTGPTFALALSVLPGAHWSALSSAGPLRHFRMIELGPGNTLTGSPLRIDERMLHHIVGEPHLDERLAGLVEAVPLPADPLVPSHRAIATRIASAWQPVASRGTMPVMQLSGPDNEGKRAVAATACAGIGADLYALSPPSARTALDEATLARLLTREAALGGCALLVDCDDLDIGDADRLASVSRLLDRITAPLLVTTRVRCRLARRPAIVHEISKPSPAEQRAIWSASIAAGGLQPLQTSTSPDTSGNAAPNLAPTIDLLVSQFDLGSSAIASACLSALADPDVMSDPGRALWETCRSQGRPRLDDLAQRIDVAAGWDDLVLPEIQRNMLRQIAVHVRHRATVYDNWGFASKGGRGLGVSALFAGTSGTGKTMAAEVLAGTLRLDLYRIDLSSMISKYIGETEKNLRRVFDAAEEGAAILLFDEADAIFGKRSEVKDSHDRYANMEVSYLLQRIEAYRGLAILTTNMKQALDPAFLRRLRFVVQFPYPEAAQRMAIWGRAFPAGTPTEGLDLQKLARLNVAGGNIRNIAINAAFLAAEAGGPVTMADIMDAARCEYGKMERPLTRELEG